MPKGCRDLAYEERCQFSALKGSGQSNGGIRGPEGRGSPPPGLLPRPGGAEDRALRFGVKVGEPKTARGKQLGYTLLPMSSLRKIDRNCSLTRKCEGLWFPVA